MGLDRLGLLGVTQLAPSSPTKGLGVIYDVMPIMTFLRAAALKTMFRMPEQFKLSWDGTAKTKLRSIAHRLFLIRLAEEWDLRHLMQ